MNVSFYYFTNISFCGLYYCLGYIFLKPSVVSQEIIPTPGHGFIQATVHIINV